MPKKDIILVVDDDPSELQLTIHYLKKTGIDFDVKTAENGEEALAYLLDDGTDIRRVKVLLLDLHMPKMDGHELLKELRSHEKTKLLPVVICSSSANEKDICKAYLLGANSYLRKPCELVDFVSYWLRVNVVSHSKRCANA